MALTRATSQRRQLEDLTCVHPNAAGWDIGSAELVGAGPPDRDPAPVRVLRTFPPALPALGAGRSWGIATVALESTGVVWVPMYERREPAGLTPSLVTARPSKTVPGRQSDGKAAPWLQQRHTLGRLRGSVRPDAARVPVRTLARERAARIARRAPHLNHVQPARKQLHSPLNVVLSDSTGVTGLAIRRAIVAGARDPARRAEWRTPGGTASVAESTKALTGHWPAAHLCIVQQARAIVDYYTNKRAVGDAELERQYQSMESRGEPNAPLPDRPRATPGAKSKNAPTCNVRAPMARLRGVALVAVLGLAASRVQTLIAEIGTAMTHFPTGKHVWSWLGLAPRHAIAGGKVLRSRTMKVRSRAHQAVRDAAAAVGRSDSAVGAA